MAVSRDFDPSVPSSPLNPLLSHLATEWITEASQDLWEGPHRQVCFYEQASWLLVWKAFMLAREILLGISFAVGFLNCFS